MLNSVFFVFYELILLFWVWLVFVLGFVVFFVNFDVIVVVVVLLLVVRDFDLDVIGYVWVMDVYSFFFMCWFLIFGVLVDWYGCCWILLLGNVVFVVVLLGCGLVWNGVLLLVVCVV